MKKMYNLGKASPNQFFDIVVQSHSGSIIRYQPSEFLGRPEPNFVLGSRPSFEAYDNQDANFLHVSLIYLIIEGLYQFSA